MIKQTDQLPLVLSFPVDIQQLTLPSGRAYQELRSTPPAPLKRELNV
jgi:hypothetical protein